MKYFTIILFAAAVVMAAATAGTAGEYHSGQTLLCYDCHTMHSSMQHNWDGTTPVPTTAGQNGNWLAAGGPYKYLLKADANALCLSCHDGQSFAPDVLGANVNASPTKGREAGALNDMAGTTPYESWKGHTLGSTSVPPGYNPTAIGAPATWYTGTTDGLECISCHAQHGPPTAYRNLGAYALGGAAASARPTYVINTTNDTTKDVWINLASYTAGLGAAATFDPYYDTANISFNRTDAAVGTLHTSNRLGTFCAACHADFHGSPGDTNIGGGTAGAAADGFLRHPTSGQTIGAATAGGHSNLPRFVANTTKVKVATTNFSTYGDATPICVTCHKAHGNQNPFGLIFLNRNALAVDEQGGFGTGQTADVPTGTRNLCGQCHGQGA